MTIHTGTDLPILIIDDVESARFLLKDMLRELGFSEFLEAQDGTEALALLRDNQVQLIFCDYVMEGMSGMEFLHAAQELESFTMVPIIFVSAVGTVSTVEAAIDRGAADYLVKPLSFRKLRRKVEEVLLEHQQEGRPVYEINLES